MAISRLAKLGIVVDTKGAKKSKKELDELTTSSKFAAAASGALASASVLAVAAMATGKVIQYADAYTTVTNRLKQATKSTRELLKAQSDVSRIAQATFSDLDSTAILYGKIGRAAEELGITQEQVSRTTETITKAIKLSGAAAAESDAAITQLAQGLASGVLRGEEFNSVAEQAPRLLEILKDELGATTGELREMAAQGRLTADVVIAAFESQSAAIDKEFATFVPTVEAGLATIGTGFTELTGAIDQTLGASSALAESFGFIGKVLSETAEGIRLVTSAEYQLQEVEKELAAKFQDKIEAQTEYNRLVDEGFFLRSASAADAVREIDEELLALIAKRDALNGVVATEAAAALEAKRLAQEAEERAAQEEAALRKVMAARAENVVLMEEERKKRREVTKEEREAIAAYDEQAAWEEQRRRENAEATIAIYQEKVDARRHSLQGELDAVAMFEEEQLRLQTEAAEKLAAARSAAEMGFFNAATGLISTLSAARSRDSEKTFEDHKDLQKGLVGINAAAAIMNELATNPDPYSKWVNIGTIIAMGVQSAAKIENQQFGGSANISGGGGAPAPASSSQAPPASQTTNSFSFDFTGFSGDEQVIIEVMQKYFDRDGEFTFD